MTSRDLPSLFKPAEGFIVSANQWFPPCEFAVGRFFASTARAERAVRLVQNIPLPDLPSFSRTQCDAYSATSKKIADIFCAAGRPQKSLPRRARDPLAILQTSDGSYDIASQGAAVSEQLLYHFATLFYPPHIRAGYMACWSTRDLIAADLSTPVPERIAALVKKAILRCCNPPRNITWGELHHLQLHDPLAGFGPAAKDYRFFDIPIGAAAIPC